MKKRLLIYLMCVALAITVVLVSGCGNVDVEAISITSADGVTEIEAGKTLQLSATITPPRASQEVMWSSGDKSKATVDNTGLVTAIAEGPVMITATSVANTNITKSFALVVTASTAVDNTPKSIVLSTANNVTTVKTGETLKITATVNPGAASQEVIWSTSDSGTATVNNGVVTGVAEGAVTITATAKNVSTVKNSIVITVSDGGSSGITADYESMSFSTHNEYMEMEKGTAIKVKGVVTYIVPGESEVSYYIQNGADAYYIYKQDAVKFPVELGKVYAVGGQKDYYFTGTHEIKTIEYFEELNESITFTPVFLNDTNKNVSILEDMNPYHGAVVSGTATIKTTPTTGTKAYNVSVTINGNSTSLRIDPANMSADEFTAINNKLATAVADTEVEFKGILTHFGYGKVPNSQIQIFKSDELTVTEATPENQIAMVEKALTVTSFVNANSDTITLVSTVSSFKDVTITWASDNTNVITSLGAVTHLTNDTVITLTATIKHKTDATAAATKEFKVNVAGSAFAGQKLVTLNLEDASAEDMNYGVSKTKSSYALKDADNNVTDEANTVRLGGNDWILMGALIASAAGGDHCDGTFALRVSEDNRNGNNRIELKSAGEYNYVEFEAAIYKNNTLGTLVGVKYKMTNGEEWVDSGYAASIDSYTLTTYRFKLPEGVKNIAIYILDGAGKVNIDNINLYK